MSEKNETETRSPQQRIKCACPSWTAPRECMQIRYGIEPGSANDYDERCECPCHDRDDDDD